MKQSIFSILLMVILTCLAAPSAAIEIHPSPEMINQAIQDGEINSSVTGIGGTTNRFGKHDDFCGGWGFLQTKLWHVREASKGNARKMKPTPVKEIAEHLSTNDMVITYAFCTLSFKPTDHHMVLKQGEKVIQPISVTVPRPNHVKGNTFMHLVQAHFSYDSFNPLATTVLIVIPSVDDKKEYELNFSDFR